MNNSLVLEQYEESTPDDSIAIREGELVKIVGALKTVRASEEWSTLKTYVFDGVVESLEKRLRSASLEAEINQPEMYRLQGQITWAKKYANLDTLIDLYSLELTRVRSQLKSPDGAGNGS